MGDRASADSLRWNLDLVLDQRGAGMADVAGGASGLLVRGCKGKEADRLVTRIDPGVVSLVAELRGHERQAAGSISLIPRAQRAMVSPPKYSLPIPHRPTGDRGWSRDKPTRDIRQCDGTCYTLVAAVVLVRSQRGRSSSR